VTADRFLPPAHPLPEPLRGNEAGTFAADTVTRRLPEIARRTGAENILDATRRQLVEALAAEIGPTPLSPIDEPENADRALWAQHVAPYLDSTWLDAPWFFIETYFFRRLLAATGYSQPGMRRGVDPFREQKRLATEGAMELAAQLGDGLDRFPLLLASSLWANRVDLSLWPADDAESVRHRQVFAPAATDRMLVDDTRETVDALAKATSVHIVLDNAGPELVADLALTAALLSTGTRVTLHTKPHPTFVSDATPSDVGSTVERLAAAETSASRLAELVLAGSQRLRLRISSHAFWVSPQPMWECPLDLAAELADADLIVVKGDANYRRMLGDLHWEPTVPLSEIVRPHRSLVALRTAKSEIAAGLSATTITNVEQEDPAWLTNGCWGMVQYVPADR
jgi:uncharacterized protein with ATP-grasp and redox domains